MCDMCDEFDGFAFVETPVAGNFIVAARAEFDDLTTVIAGYTVGDRIASVAVMYVGDEVIESRDEFLSFVAQTDPEENGILHPTAIFPARSKEEYDSLIKDLPEKIKGDPCAFVIPVSDDEFRSAIYDRMTEEQMESFASVFGDDGDDIQVFVL